MDFYLINLHFKVNIMVLGRPGFTKKGIKLYNLKQDTLTNLEFLSVNINSIVPLFRLQPPSLMQ